MRRSNSEVDLHVRNAEKQGVGTKGGMYLIFGLGNDTMRPSCNVAAQIDTCSEPGEAGLPIKAVAGRLLARPQKLDGYAFYRLSDLDGLTYEIALNAPSKSAA